MCEAVNQKAIADSVAQKLQRECQQIVCKVGAADVKQNFLIPFVDLAINTIKPSAQLVQTDILSGRCVIRLFLKIALRQFNRGQIIPAADFVGSRAAVAEKLKNRERKQQKNDGWMDGSNQSCVENQTERKEEKIVTSYRNIPSTPTQLLETASVAFSTSCSVDCSVRTA